MSVYTALMWCAFCRDNEVHSMVVPRLYKCERCNEKAKRELGVR